MKLDDYIEGTFDSANPANQDEMDLEPLTELEEQQEWNLELRLKNERLKNDLKKLAEIEEIFSMLGTLTFEEQKAKTEILNKYL